MGHKHCSNYLTSCKNLLFPVSSACDQSVVLVCLVHSPQEVQKHAIKHMWKDGSVADSADVKAVINIKFLESLRSGQGQQLIFQFSEQPNPAGREGNDCSASPKETCSSCEKSGCILPKQQHSPLVYFQPGIGGRRPLLELDKWHKCHTLRPSSTWRQHSTFLEKTFCLPLTLSLKRCCVRGLAPARHRHPSLNHGKLYEPVLAQRLS